MSKLKPNTDKKQQNENIVPNRLQTIERSTENKSVTINLDSMCILIRIVKSNNHT